LQAGFRSAWPCPCRSLPPTRSCGPLRPARHHQDALLRSTHQCFAAQTSCCFLQAHDKPKRFFSKPQQTKKVIISQINSQRKGRERARVVGGVGATCAAQVQALQRGTMHAVAWRRPAGEKNVGAMHDKTDSVVNWLRQRVDTVMQPRAYRAQHGGGG
jgi:hypothetical protein